MSGNKKGFIFYKTIPPFLSSTLDLIRLNNLKFLNLRSCSIAQLPNALFTLSKLETLLIDNNNVTRISSAIGNLKSLTVLSAQNNLFET